MLRHCCRSLSRKHMILNKETSKVSLWTAVWRDAELRAANNISRNKLSKPHRIRRFSTGWDGSSGPESTNDNGSLIKTLNNNSKYLFAIFAISSFGYLFSRNTYCKSLENDTNKLVNKIEDDDALPQSNDEDEEKNEDKKVVTASFPNNVPFLLIGGGTASYYAALTIRAKIPDAHCVIITDEETTPYNRTPLTRDVWWYGDEKTPQNLEYTTISGKKRQVPYESNGYYIKPDEIPEFEHGAISIIKGKKVIKLEPENHKAILDDGTEILYNKCLIGTGSTAKKLSIFDDEKFNNHVTTLRNIEDYRKVIKKINEGKKDFVVIGGGLLGTELSVSLSRTALEDSDKTLKITQIFRGKGVLRKELPEYMSSYTTTEIEKMGVNVKGNSNVVDSKILNNGKIKLIIENDKGEKEEVVTDYVIVAVGATPNIELGKVSGFEIDSSLGGICSDSGMRTTLHPDVFVAGDVSSFYDPIFGRRRLEHWEHAQISGRVAGENMVGGSKTYTHQGSWYTLLGPNMHYTGVGRIDSSLPTVSIFAQDVDDDSKTKDGDDIQKAVVFYIDNKQIVGVLLVNVFGIGVEVGRRLIMDRKEIENFVEVSKLFALYPGPDTEEDEKEKKEEESSKQ